MPDAVERRRAHEEQMHQMAVVRHDAVHNFESQPTWLSGDGRIARRLPSTMVSASFGGLNILVIAA